ncbi:MAG: Lrp/AsnC family transcriptional regulator [Halodesulfurarchaeum sp.]
MELDDTDRAILRELQQNARTPFSEIARRIDMSSATVHDRVKRMEEAGVIRGYHAEVEPSALGLEIEALVGLRIEQGSADRMLERLQDVEAVQEVVLVTGEWDAIMRIVAKSTDELRELMFDRIANIEGFDRSQTMVVLGHEIDSNELPMDA